MENRSDRPLVGGGASFNKGSESNRSIRPKPEAVVNSNSVSFKKQSAWKRAKHRIFEKEGKDLKNYVINDVLIPSIKETISNVVSNGIDILLYGEARHIASRRSSIFGNSGGSRYGNYVTYNSISNPRTTNTGVRSGISSSAALRESLALDDILFETRVQANDVLSRMSDILSSDRNHIVTVADLYNLCGLVAPFTYNNYGWDDLSTAGVTLTKDGYLLNLPTPYEVL